MKQQKPRSGGKFTIGVIQMEFSTKPAENMEAAAEQVGKAASDGAQVICLPELYRSQYFCQREDAALFDLAEPSDGPSFELFSRVARKHRAAIIVPFFERRAPGLYHNSALIIDADGSLLGVYRKMHIPDDPSYYEKFYFAPGDLGFRAFDTRFGRIGVLICWDQWYPEAARLTALQNAPVLFYPTAIGWHPREKAAVGERQRDAWVTVQRGHAIANGVYVAAANRTGIERPAPGDDGIEFWGSSFIADPQGAILADGGSATEAILLAEIDPAHLEDVRRNWPFLRDRRIDAYGDITRRLID
ncbi:MAG TPA: carbon-nitrogen hydrolase [Verrucomicrobiae bacterium]|nr:carbon-nitrogen hydrolase [Verrucomicrobiae bacterium]